MQSILEHETTKVAPAAKIELRGLHKTYRTPSGEVVAVRDVDLGIAAGETVALLGPKERVRTLQPGFPAKSPCNFDRIADDLYHLEAARRRPSGPHGRCRRAGRTEYTVRAYRRVVGER
jgi:hypothetical protein